MISLPLYLAPTATLLKPAAIGFVAALVGLGVLALLWYASAGGWEEIDWKVAVLIPVTLQMIDGSTQLTTPTETTEVIRAVICPACFAARNAPPDFFPVSRGRVPELSESPEDKTLRLLTDPDAEGTSAPEAPAPPEDI